MQAHRTADHFIANNYFDARTGKGCGIGCGIETINRLLGLSLKYDSHTDLANALGWPVWLCRMEDRIFEGLPPLERSAWPVDLATAVPEGVDLEPALNQILARMLREVVLPVAGSSAAIVQHVADGCATNWASDDPREASQVAAYVYALATADAAYAAYAVAYVGATAHAAAAAAARQNTWLAIAQIVLEEVVKVEKLT